MKSRSAGPTGQTEPTAAARRASRAQSAGWVRLDFVLALAVILAPGSLLGAGSDFSISVGEGTVLPGQTELLLPVIISTPQDLHAWSTSVSYDTDLLQLIGVQTLDTVSEALAPVVELTPSLPPYDGVRFEYAPDAPLPAGEDMTVAYLRFGILPGALPSGSGALVTVVILGGPGIESFPLIFELQGGGSEPPPASSSELLFYFGNVLQAVSTTGSYYEVASASSDPLRIEFRLWSEAPSSIITLRVIGGQELIDEFLVSHGTGGTILESVSDTDVELNVVDGDLVITIEAQTASIPASIGEPLLFLELTPLAPAQGTLPLILDPDGCDIDGTSIENLISGELVLLDAFVRGDVNFDGSFDVSDPVELLLYVLGYTSDLICPDAADIDDDEVIAINDAVLALAIMFQEDSPPPPPYDSPGVDPSSGAGHDELGCLPPL